MSGFIALLVIGLSLFASFTVSGVFDAYAELMEAQSQYATCSSAAAELQEASDYLFTKARSFVVTGERKHLDDYVNEMSVNNWRGNAVQTLEEYLMGTVAHLELLQANMQSNALSQLELKAIKLAASGYGITDLPEEAASVQLSDDLAALSPSKKVKEAQQILFGDSYEEQKRGIDSLVDECATSLIESLEQEESRCEARVSELLGRLRVAILLFLASVLLSIWITIHYLVNPTLGFAENINQDEPLKQTGAREVRYVAATYNAMYERNKAQIDALRREAERDAMTGLLNRGSYDRILEETAGSKALILVDVDLFKLVNDKFGHEMGDAKGGGPGDAGASDTGAGSGSGDAKGAGTGDANGAETGDTKGAGTGDAGNGSGNTSKGSDTVNGIGFANKGDAATSDDEKAESGKPSDAKGDDKATAGQKQEAGSSSNKTAEAADDTALEPQSAEYIERIWHRDTQTADTRTVSEPDIEWVPVNVSKYSSDKYRYVDEDGYRIFYYINDAYRLEGTDEAVKNEWVTARVRIGENGEFLVPAAGTGLNGTSYRLLTGHTSGHLGAGGICLAFMDADVPKDAFTKTLVDQCGETVYYYPGGEYGPAGYYYRVTEDSYITKSLDSRYVGMYWHFDADGGFPFAGTSSTTEIKEAPTVSASTTSYESATATPTPATGSAYVSPTAAETTPATSDATSLAGAIAAAISALGALGLGKVVRRK